MKHVLFLLLLLCGGSLCAQETPIRVGAERMELFLDSLTGQRVGIVANHTSLVGSAHLVDTMLACGVDVKSIFCPEHGFRGQAEAGAHVQNGIDPRTQLPIVSLYGKNKKPSPEQLNDLDIILFDLQDVGCRFYTYISTLHYVMEACAEQGIRLMVLDRPNPNGSYIDGPVLDSGMVSFVGMRPGTPIVYGMTIGEYALMIDQEHPSPQQGYSLTVVPLENYSHDMPYHLPIAPSPNLQTDQAIALYPSLCWFEGCNISVGRGTKWPFEVVGSPNYPYPDITFTPKDIPGVSVNPPFKGRMCYGLDLRHTKPSTTIDLSYLLLMYRNTPKENFFLKNGFFDKLAGTKQLRKQLISGADETEIRASWQEGIEKFKEVRKRFLLYQ